jgi:hypothetical protein
LFVSILRFNDQQKQQQQKQQKQTPKWAQDLISIAIENVKEMNYSTFVVNKRQ